MVQCIYNNSAKVFVNIIIGVFYQSMSVCSQIIVCICFYCLSYMDYTLSSKGTNTVHFLLFYTVYSFYTGCTCICIYLL